MAERLIPKTFMSDMGNIRVLSEVTPGNIPLDTVIIDCVGGGSQKKIRPIRLEF